MSGTADTTILHGPHRIICTGESKSTFDVRVYAMPLYGPQEWFEILPQTLTSDGCFTTGEPRK